MPLRRPARPWASISLIITALILLALLALASTWPSRPSYLLALIISLAVITLVLMGWLVVKKKLVCAPITVVP